MGASVAKQTSQQIINNSYTIANNAVQSCKQSTLNQFDATAGGTCKQTFGPINITNGTVIEANCVQNVTVKNSMKAQITAQIISQVNAAAQSFGGPSASIADSLNTFAQDTAETISSQFTQNCTGFTDNSSQFSCSGSASQTFQAINVTNTTNGYFACANDATIQNGLVSKLTDKISTTTSAKEADSLTTVVVVVLIFLGIFAFIWVRTLNGPIGWVVVILVVALIIGLIVYAIYAYANKLYPFNFKS